MLNRKKNEQGEVEGIFIMMILALPIMMIAIIFLISNSLMGETVKLEKQIYASSVQSKVENLFIENPSITNISLAQNPEGQYVVYGWVNATDKAFASEPLDLESVDVALIGTPDEYKIIAAYSKEETKFMEETVEIPGYGSLTKKVYDTNDPSSDGADVAIYDSVTREITSK